MTPHLPALLDAARQRRTPLLAGLEAKGTDCYRLFHGATEGHPGLTVDRYGPLLWVQTFREPLSEGDLEIIASTCGPDLVPVWNHRARKQPPNFQYQLPAEAQGPNLAHEGGLAFEIAPRPWGKDPWLFLDFRSTRRWIRHHAEGATVLNLFAYTCGIGVAALAGGAAEVWNVDFADSALAVGRRNLAHNGFAPTAFRTIQADVIPTIRQLAGLPVKGRAARKRRYPRFAPRGFDLVVLDPPTWATTPFGAIDPVRDYPSLFKPSVLATHQGGTVIATNHVSTVDRDEWIGVLERCAAKAGRPVRSLEVLAPDGDFPSPDGKHPLKVAVVGV